MSINVRIIKMYGLFNYENIDDMSHTVCNFDSNHSLNTLISNIFYKKIFLSYGFGGITVGYAINITKEDVRFIIDSISSEIMNIIKGKKYKNFKQISDLALAGEILQEFYIENEENDLVFKNLMYVYEF